MKSTRKAPHTSSETDIVAYLSDTKCLRAWSWVHHAILGYQSAGVDDDAALPWTHARAQANEMLNIAQRVMETYRSDEFQDLTMHGDERIGAELESKLRTLLLFDSIYSRPTRESTFVSKSHQFRLFFDNSLRVRRDAVNDRRNRGYDRTHQNTQNVSSRSA